MSIPPNAVRECLAFERDHSVVQTLPVVCTSVQWEGRSAAWHAVSIIRLRFVVPGSGSRQFCSVAQALSIGRLDFG